MRPCPVASHGSGLVGSSITPVLANKELVGVTASDIELLTKVKNRDRRIFQDGVYIINKDGKVLV